MKNVLVADRAGAQGYSLAGDPTAAIAAGPADPRKTRP
jgi:hypothetical protein